MKKCVSILLSLLMLLTMVPMGALVSVSAETVTVPSGPYFAVSAVAGKAGDTVIVSVSAMNNPGIVSTKVRVGYDPTVLKLVEYEVGDFSEGDYSWSEIDHNPFIINWCNALEPDSTEERLATLTFEIVDGAACGATPLTLIVKCGEDVFDYDLITVPFETVNGEVYVLYPATGIVLSQSGLELLEGESATLTATLSAAGLTDNTVEWQSSDASVAMVDANGVVTALKKGSAVITATAVHGGVSAACTVNVACAHAYSGVVIAPDCVNGGWTTYTCEKCGDSYAADDTDALGHTEEILPGYDATCTEDGLTEGKKCSVCGEVLVAQETIEATGHTEVAIPGYDATCTEGGLTEGKKCDLCGEVLVAQETIEATGHTEEILPGYDATCTEDGLTEGKKCSVCGEVLVAQETIEATGHTEEILLGYDATCTEDGLTEGKKCSVCGEVLVAQETIEATGHTEVAIPGYDATCTEDGLTVGKTCYVCGEITVAQQVIPAKGHTEIIDAGVAATCTITGLTEGKHCSVCDEVLIAQQIVPAVGHTYDAVVTAPDCLNGGYTTYTCACGDSYVANKVPAVGHVYDDVYDAECNICGFIRDAQCKHTYEAVVTDPDCINRGYTTYTCSACGDSYVEDYTAAVGHMAVAVSGTAPTCTENGLTDGYKCSACDVMLIAQEVILAKGHTEVIIPGTASTCTATGLTEGKKCNLCGEVTVAQMTIAATGHTEIVIPGYDATCTETGLTEGKQCSVCGEVTVAQMTIAATGHTEIVIPGYDATCTETGLTEGKQCSVCDEVIVAQQVIVAVGHIYEAVVTDPTCVAEGYTTYTCACGDSYVADKMPATGEHTYDDADDADCNVCGAVREVQTVLLGDVDGNGRVNNRDLGRLQQYINEWDVTVHLEACDMDDNGRINNRDLGRLQQYINEWDGVQI